MATDGTSTDQMRIYMHNYDTNIIMKMSPDASFDPFQICVPHLSFLCSFPKGSFDKHLGNSLHRRDGKGIKLMLWNSHTFTYGPIMENCNDHDSSLLQRVVNLEIINYTTVEENKCCLTVRTTNIGLWWKLESEKARI